MSAFSWNFVKLRVNILVKEKYKLDGMSQYGVTMDRVLDWILDILTTYRP
jgi:hypothetical protein